MQCLPYLLLLLAVHALPPPILQSAWDWPFPATPSGAATVPTASLLHEASDSLYLVLTNCAPPGAVRRLAYMPCEPAAPPDTVLASTLYRLSASTGAVQWATPVRPSPLSGRNSRRLGAEAEGPLPMPSQGQLQELLARAAAGASAPAARRTQFEEQQPAGGWSPLAVASSGLTVFYTGMASTDADGNPSQPFLHAIDAVRGTPLWNISSDPTLHLTVSSTPAFHSRSSAAVYSDGAFPSADPLTGRPRTRLPLPLPSGLLVARNSPSAPTVLTLSLQALHERTGVLLWSSPPVAAPYGDITLLVNPALSLALLTQGRRLSSTYSNFNVLLPGVVSAFDLRTGSLAWTYPPPPCMAGSGPSGCATAPSLPTDPLTSIIYSVALPPAPSTTVLLAVASGAALREYSLGYLSDLPKNMTQVLLNATSVFTADARAEGIVSFAMGSTSYSSEFPSPSSTLAAPELLLQGYNGTGRVAWRWPLPSGGYTTSATSPTSTTLSAVTLGLGEMAFFKSLSSAPSPQGRRLLVGGYQIRRIESQGSGQGPPSPATDDPVPVDGSASMSLNSSVYVLDAGTGRTLFTLPDSSALDGTQRFSFLVPDCAMGAGGGTFVLGLASTPADLGNPSPEPPLILFQMVGVWQQQGAGFAWRKPVHDSITLEAAGAANINPVGLCGSVSYIVVGAALTGIGAGPGAPVAFGVSRLAPGPPPPLCLTQPSAKGPAASSRGCSNVQYCSSCCCRGGAAKPGGPGRRPLSPAPQGDAVLCQGGAGWRGAKGGCGAH